MLIFLVVFFFFFFKQKTAYEIRKGDWSSDVCSSDLVDRRSAFDGAPGLHGEELHDQVPLRVPTPASPELAVLDRRVERVVLPLVQRVDGLDVVVLVHHEGGLPLVDDHLSKDDVGTPFRRIFAGLETVLREEPSHERRGLRLSPLVRRDRRETAVLFQRLKGLLRIRFHPSKDVRQGHATPAAGKPGGHKNPMRKTRRQMDLGRNEEKGRAVTRHTRKEYLGERLSPHR